MWDRETIVSVEEMKVPMTGSGPDGLCGMANGSRPGAGPDFRRQVYRTRDSVQTDQVTRPESAPETPQHGRRYGTPVGIGAVGARNAGAAAAADRGQNPNDPMPHPAILGTEQRFWLRLWEWLEAGYLISTSAMTVIVKNAEGRERWLHMPPRVSRFMVEKLVEHYYKNRGCCYEHWLHQVPKPEWDFFWGWVHRQLELGVVLTPDDAEVYLAPGQLHTDGCYPYPDRVTKALVTERISAFYRGGRPALPVWMPKKPAQPLSE